MHRGLIAKLAIPLILLSLVLVTGCGDDDDADDGGGTPSAQSGVTETAPPGNAELESCLSEAKLEVRDKDEEFTNAEGETKTREDLDIDGATYLGYVQWPSKSIADIYVLKDEAAAEKAEKEAGAFVQAFGFDPEKYVRRAGTVVMTFDDPPPSDDEAKAVEDCATG